MASERPRVRHDLVAGIREIENVFVAMSDGCRIAARIWLPRDAEEAPVPAILESIPYRKRDFMRERDEPIHRYFAGHGYAAVRVDLRGSGDSEGVLHDEYSAQEHRDVLEVLAWIADQPWCDGSVGMMGISWGGFNALQVAALRPPQLRAVITLCSTDDRYADDAHYMGGCLLNENLQWGSILTLYNTMPPDPEIVGERWRRMWLERLDAVEPLAALWMRHPWRDDYWKHGSVCEDYAAIECPVYAVGGWADGYSNAVPRLLAGLSCPRKGLIGPWAHTFPHSGVPGPRIGFLQEAVRWWDQWLRGRETGIMEEPLLRVWMQESVPPRPEYDHRPGRWVAEEEWPSPRIAPVRWALGEGRLSREGAAPSRLEVASPQSTGRVAGEWCAFGADGEMPLDQRVDDEGSLVFDSEPLCEAVEILGAPRLELTVSADRPVALVAARLCDVAPGGAATRVTYGVLNLTHHAGHERPVPLAPGEPAAISLELNDIAHVFPAGHRLRLALSSSYWPVVWPAPEPVTLTVDTGGSALTIPVRPARLSDAELPEFGAPEVAPGSRHEPLRPLPFERRLERDRESGEWIATLESDGGEFGGHSLARLEEIDLELGYTLFKQHRILDHDPLSARSELRQRVVLRRGEWSVRIVCRTALIATGGHFRLEGELVAEEGGAEVRRRAWDERVERRLV